MLLYLRLHSLYYSLRGVLLLLFVGIKGVKLLNNIPPTSQLKSSFESSIIDKQYGAFILIGSFLKQIYYGQNKDNKLREVL